ncbi:MAG: hypothetical protein SFV15_19755 [Polyangiaceae bacterium]|nr:hypothetical protein [Polyangiaceae bacterium]
MTFRLSSWFRSAVALVAACAAAIALGNGCGSDGGGGAAAGMSGGAGGMAGTSSLAGNGPGNVGSTAACVLSADCASGYHCDLGECLKSCDEGMPCAVGLTCSVRGECVSSANAATPSTTSAGTFTVEPRRVPLTERDTSFDLTLTSDSTKAVNYRVELVGAHLGLSELRGSFTKTKKLTITSNPAQALARKSPGSVRIFTDLGNVTVDAPLRVGLTGRYQGVMSYNGGQVSLGEARFTAELLAQQGNVSARIDPKESLLFPAISGQPTFGVGFESGEELTLTFDQKIPKEVGGDRNLLGRDIGRRVKLVVKPFDRDSLAGTFEETLFGLFVLPVKVNGTVTLRYRGDQPDPVFTPGPAITQPTGAATWLSATQALGASGECSALLAGVSVCGANWQNGKTACFESVASSSYKLDVAMANRTMPGKGFDAIVSDCASGLASCANVPNLACAAQAAAMVSVADAANAGVFGRLVRRFSDPSLLIANDIMVKALRDSLSKDSLTSELTSYDAAATRLSTPIRWLLQSGMLDYLERLDPVAAQGDMKNGEASFPAARALSKLLRLLSAVEGERGRLNALASSADPSGEIQKAQERGLQSYLESIALLHLLETWNAAAPEIATQAAGLLTPLDGAFRSLSQGAATFGIPEGFVPFVWQPNDLTKGATNFEQMAKVAETSLAAVTQAEANFLANARTFDQNEQELLTELQAVAVSYDTQLKDICGATFNPDAITKDSDWEMCGSAGTGEIAVAQGQVVQAQGRLSASLSRVQGMRDKLAIDEDALAQKQGVRKDTLRFIDSTGSQLSTLIMAEGVINAIQVGLELSSNASLLNGGASIGMGVASAILETQKTALNVQRQNLQTAQTMRFEQQNAKLELIDGMASLQRQLIDINQVALEMEQDKLLVLENDLRVRNLLDQAKLVLNNRAGAKWLAANSPANDPSFRLLRDKLAISVLNARANAQRMLLLVGRALEYEVNTPFGAIEGAVINARNASSLGELATCFTTIHNDYVLAYGNPQAYSTNISVRSLLGVEGPILDPATGQMLSPGQQFRELALRNENLDPDGGLTLQFSTNLQPGNQLWSSDVCGDRITDVQAQLVGDFLGDNQTQVNVSLAGSAVLRTCDTDDLRSWSLGKGKEIEGGALAIVQGGVNTFGDAPPNQSLAGQSVARSTWRVSIPSKTSAPSNSDVDLTKLEDVVLKVQHKALPKRMSPLNVNVSCLMSIQ